MNARTRHRWMPARFLRSQQGMAAVEFALIVPVMLLAYLGTTDLTQALAIDRKLGQLSSTVSDLVAQEETITCTSVRSVFNAASGIMRPFEASDTTVTLAIVNVSGSTATTVGSAVSGTAGCSTTSEEFPLTEDMLALADGRTLIMASANYDYTPMFATVFDTVFNLEQHSFNLMRQADFEIDLSDGSTPPADPDTDTDPDTEESDSGSETGSESGSDSDSGTDTDHDRPRWCWFPWWC